MGTETLPDSATVASGLLIKSADFLTVIAAFQGAFVGRNTSGVPTSGQSLGTALYPWGNLYANALTIGGSTIDVSEVSVPPTRIVSGATTTNSGQPAFLQANGAAATVTILATTTDLVLSINSTTITISADITETGLTTAPAANNTCAINDANFTDQAESKYFGEIDSRIPYITIDTVGSEISALVGQWITLKGATEYMFGWLKSATELVNVYRGFFFDSSNAPIVREVLNNNDTLTLMKTGWIFVDDDGSTIDVTYKSPVYAFTAPTSPVADDYWYDISNVTWKRYSGAAWVAVDRIPVGLCIQNTANCIATRSFDFYGGFKELNTLDCEVFSDTVIRSSHQTNQVNVYGEDLTFENTAVDWDNTTDMASGAVANDTDYYLYLSTLGDPKIDTERPYDRTADLRGKYHPYNNWRYIAKAKTDGAADWISVVASAAFDTEPGLADFDPKNLLINTTGNDTFTLAFDQLELTNAEGKTKTLPSYSQSLTFSGLLQGSELSSHWYDVWIDSRAKIKCTPRLTGTADSTEAGFLTDAAADFPSYSVFKGATVYNTSSGTSTAVSVSPTASGSDLALTADIFASGAAYAIGLVNPVGLDSFACNIGRLYNNSSGHLDDSGYTRPELQKLVSYIGTTDFTMTGDVAATAFADIIPYQVIGRVSGEEPKWRAIINGQFTVGSGTTRTLTFSGITFKNKGTVGPAVAAWQTDSNTEYTALAYCNKNTSSIIMTFSAASTGVVVSADVELENKPTFATRS